MTANTTQFALAAALCALTACASESGGERHAIEYFELTGSCTVSASADRGLCGGPSSGNCWCDELCTDIGDCCADKLSVCDDVATCAEFGGHCFVPAINEDGPTSCEALALQPSDGVCRASREACCVPMSTCEAAEPLLLCNNGIDEDCDGLTDCEDPDCTFWLTCLNIPSPCEVLGGACTAVIEGQDTACTASGLVEVEGIPCFAQSEQCCFESTHPIVTGQ